MRKDSCIVFVPTAAAAVRAALTKRGGGGFGVEVDGTHHAIHHAMPCRSDRIGYCTYLCYVMLWYVSATRHDMPPSLKQHTCVSLLLNINI